MLKAIMAAIRGAMRRLARLLLVTVEIGGRLVSMLRVQPEFEQEEPVSAGAGYETPGQAQVPSATSDENRYDRIRALATDLARNPAMSPTEILQRGVGVSTAAWLSSMNPRMLCRVALSSDQQLGDCIAGRRPIRGVFEFDPTTAKPGSHARAHREGVRDAARARDQQRFRDVRSI